MNKKPSVIICGCAKDCEQYIDCVFKNIEKLKEIFEIRLIYIAFDISSDNTKEKLLEKKGTFNIELLENSKPLIKCSKDRERERVLNICNARNRYMEKITNSTEKSDYFIVMDMDDVCSEEMNINPIKDVINDSDNWDGITFDNTRYYDFWALSIKPFTVSCFISKDPVKTIRSMFKKLEEQRKNSLKYMDCQSSFNGFGIYKTSLYNSYYTPFHSKQLHSINDIVECLKKHDIMYNNYFFKDNIIDCEHRSFHMMATQKNNARLKICKQQIFADYRGEHVRWLYDN
tara:strand:- start:1525 stop:2385 length:861 start_codon:yes stop_codon:yes gene_type:complete